MAGNGAAKGGADREGELERLDWREDDLRSRAKGHAGKVVIARRLRQETTMSLDCGATAVAARTYVSNLVNLRGAVLPSRQELLLLGQ
jgi:hypothetical protein